MSTCTVVVEGGPVIPFKTLDNVSVNRYETPELSKNEESDGIGCAAQTLKRAGQGQLISLLEHVHMQDSDACCPSKFGSYDSEGSNINGKSFTEKTKCVEAGVNTIVGGS
jgi:hypothetical protein